MCGHATLACAYVLFRFYIPDADKVVFSTLSGNLTVSKTGDLLEMEFPAYKLEKVPVTDAMIDANIKSMWYRFSRREDDYCIECSEDGQIWRLLNVNGWHMMDSSQIKNII